MTAPQRTLSRTLSRAQLRVLLAVFVLSRAAGYAAGVRFNPKLLTYGGQYVDPPLLQHDLVSSLWNLHVQPPLFNLYTGLVLHLPEALRTPAFAGTFLVSGLLLAWALAALLAELGVSPRVATALSAVVVASPAALLYENWLYFTYPVAALLTLAALLLLRYLRTGRRAPLVGLWASLGALSLIRSTYHLAWLVAVLALLVVVRRSDWRRLVATAAVPVLLLLGVYVKNDVKFGTFSASSWDGMNEAAETTFAIPQPERESLVAQGKLSPLALVRPYSDPRAYPAELAEMRAHPSGVAVLDEPLKANGSVNFNARMYIGLSQRYGADARKALRLHPGAAVHSFLATYQIYFLPTADYRFLDPDRHSIAAWYRVYLDVAELRVGPSGATPALLARAPFPASGMSLTWMAVYALALLGGLGTAVRLLLRPKRPRPRATPAELTVVFVAVTVAWTTLAAGLVSSGENNRFRFESDPVTLAVAALVVAQLARGVRARRTREVPPVASGSRPAPLIAAAPGATAP